MDNETLFFISGIALAVSAVLFTVAALRIEKFPGRAAPIVALWFIAAAVNMWIGVARAGYSFMEELPIFLLIFLLPATVAVLVKWRFL